MVNKKQEDQPFLAILAEINRDLKNQNVSLLHEEGAWKLARIEEMNKQIKFSNVEIGSQFYYKTEYETDPIIMEKISDSQTEKNTILVNSGRRIFIASDKLVMQD